MKVLMISTDRLIFKTDSEVRQRMLDYGGLFEELQIIVFANKKLGLAKEQLATNVFIYPTNSISYLGCLWQAVRLGRILLAAKGDWVISSQDPFATGLVAWWLKRRTGARWQAQIHTDFLSPFFVRESWLNWLKLRIAIYLLPQADRIRVVSERIKRSLAGWSLKSEPVVLPIFVPRDDHNTSSAQLDLHQKYPQFSFIILMASRLTREKNFPLALKALAKALLNQPKLGLVIVGQGPEKKSLQNLAQTLQLNGRVIFEAWQDHLNDYYQTADLFLLTSDYEGYGRTIIEAGLNRCPILTTDIGLVGEIINPQNALICPVGDRDCLAQKISWAVTNRRLLTGLVQQLTTELNQKVINNKSDYLNKYRQATIT